ncbi:MAG: metallophosphoesterase [Treponema sp. GWB1_62_6]|nr:MAG: metallophosphoesterase [Treponema sp. GWA1_62_8]OHE67275.1 MAG: metallophosphoesterase [Treponema sp. GWC1_61_84]OHE71247.1 MAG: metallophosphoesterase [Treponema sp. GWB1_62_6]OHE75820.1 MAG: metallophosphoesterase [Treponema sp. RIFOXYC1_FULL_61_9]HCM28850.1 metallophosphoesterase [Treponema sp.]
MSMVKALMIGDVVGDAGLAALEAELGTLARELGADLTVVNGENAAGGFGLTAETLARILAAGADIVTTGNHVWEKREVWPVLDAEARVVRPANYPAGAAGRGSATLEKAGILWGVLNIQGREDMSPIDCPFRVGEELARALAESGAVVLVDFHAESTQEKEAMAFHLDGVVSALVGTHTHVQTADARVLPKGTAYMTDLGMSGVRDGIIGMDAAICMERGRSQVPRRMECAEGPASIRGALIVIDTETRKAESIEPVDRIVTANRG